MIALVRKMQRKAFAPLNRSEDGSAAIEFSLLAPIFFALMFGVMQVGVYLQNYNAVQSLASDGARYVMVEYQKDNELSDEQIRQVMLGEAVNAPYMLNTDRLQVTVDRTGTSRVSGAVEIDITMAYTMEEFIPGVRLPGGTISYSRPVWVVPNTSSP